MWMSNPWAKIPRELDDEKCPHKTPMNKYMKRSMLDIHIYLVIYKYKPRNA